MKRIILHCDMNNFYASVECALNPALRGKPIAVCGAEEERHGIVLAKSNEAKKYGVSTGDAIWQAKQKCPQIVIVQPRYGEYGAYSRAARAIYEQYTDQVEAFGQDECWLDVTGSTGLFGTGEEIAHRIREQIKRELGLTVSVGVSFNKVFAKLGSDMKKPDAVTVITAEDFRQKIWDLPASDMLGVGRKTAKKLSDYGIVTIGQLAAAPEELMRYFFGKCGVMIREYANGRDTSPVLTVDAEVPEKSIGHGFTAPKDLENGEEVFQMMLDLCGEIGHRLYQANKQATGVAVHIRDCELMWTQWQTGLTFPTQSAAVLAKAAYALFQKRYLWLRTVRSVSVRAIGLCPMTYPVQLDFFCDAAQFYRREDLARTVETIRQKHGRESICHASLLYRKPCHYAGSQSLP